MSSFWIFLAFMGIAALIKRHEAAAKEVADTTDVPTNQKREEIERRIRELFEEAYTPTAKTTPGPVESRAEVPQPRLVTHAATLSKPKPESSRATTQSTNKAVAGSSFKSTQTQTATRTTQNPSAAKSEIELAMEDFSLERAVIYSEILEPKFKEY